MKVRWYSKLYLLTVLGLILVPNLKAQTIIGARSIAVGGAQTALANNEWALFGNPSSLYSNPDGVAFYSLRNYGISELTDIAFSGNYAIKDGMLSAGIHRYGDDLYHETNIKLGYAFEWQQVQWGVSTGLHVLGFGGDYGSGSAFTLDVGGSIPIQDKWVLAATATNLFNGAYHFEETDEELSSAISVGIQYSLEERALFLFDVVKDVQFPLAIRAGVEMDIVSNFVGRVGVSTEPNTYSGGLGYQAQRFSFNFVVQHHQILGTSPGLDMKIYLK